MSAVVLDDVKDYLNIISGGTDAKLQGFIDAAEAMLTVRVGPLTPITVTSTVTPGASGTMFLPLFPVVSVTSVTDPSGNAVLGSTIDGAGRLSPAASTFFTCAPYTVVYTVGYATLPADLALAVKEQVRHLWETQRGGTNRPGSQAMAGPVPGSAYALPYRVQSLIAPYHVPGVA